MTSAWDIALTAYDQALVAVADEEAANRKREEEAKAAKLEAGRALFEKVLPTLQSWFPGVEWTWELGGDFDYDVIVTDKADGNRPSFKLKVGVRGKERIVEVGDYRADSSVQGYNYFSGTRIKSAADLGRWIRSQGDRL